MKSDDFKQFFKEVHGYEPFPWQVRLLNDVLSHGWPSVISMPTSAGKTSVLDIALFSLAAQADLLPAERTAPVRIIYVVDRRVVVDEAFDRAMRIKKAIETASEDSRVLYSIGQSLRKINGGGDLSAVDVIRMRGGLPGERPFISDPMKPTMAISTVDQTGSKILFSGYGVSNSMRPVHAAMVGVDSLIILDEAHISRPFSETLTRVSGYEGENWYDVPVAKPLKFVEMSATPHNEVGSVFEINDDDLDNEELNSRIACEKPAELIEIKVKTESMDEARELLSKRMVSESLRMMAGISKKTDSPPVIGIIANTVATSRRVFEMLSESSDYDSTLLIGRNRPYYRDLLMNALLPRIKSGRMPEDNGKSLFVVATQSLEVGADVDFDGLITEASSFDSLRQRFGRLNRLGKRLHASGVIIRPDYGKLLSSEPVYGETTGETWKWLTSAGTKVGDKGKLEIDMGSLRIDSIKPDHDTLSKMLPPVPQPPILTPAQMDLFVQTNPVPVVHPHVPFYLHGVEKQQEDVQVIWRSNLPESREGKFVNDLISTVAALPPSHGEVISIPIGALISFLNGNGEEAVSDLEGQSSSRDTISGKNGKYAILWSGPDDSEIIDLDKISPGDTIVIPASYGGVDEYGWNPRSNKSVSDIAEIARAWEHGTSPVRIERNLVKEWFNTGDGEKELTELELVIADGMQRYADGEDLKTISKEILDAIINTEFIKQEILTLLRNLGDDFASYVYPSQENAKGIVLANIARTNYVEFTDEDDTSSISKPMSLEMHCRQVAEKARDYATLAGIPELLVSDIALAGKLHDLGKADPRFQTWLRGGESGPSTEKLLAKSGHFIANDRLSMERSREAAGLPKGLRHECYSSAIAMSNKSLGREAHDRSLVMYLVGAHHGHGRPFQKTVNDDGIDVVFSFDGVKLSFNGPHGLDSLDSGWPDIFWNLTRKYGYWGLAYLETIVRLSDHEVSRSYSIKRGKVA